MANPSNTTSRFGAVNEGQVLAASFHQLVRSARSAAESALPPLARRLLETWSDMPELDVTVGPTRVSVDEAVISAEDRHGGDWILPAFLAGLRSLHPREDCTEEDVLLLAEELASADADSEAVGDLHDWLWAGGAEGFHIDLQLSFTEALDATDARERAEDSLRALRMEAAAPLDDGFAVGAEELDAAAVRVEFDVPMREYVDELREQVPRIDDGERRAFVESVEDPAAWTYLEVQAALRIKQVREAVPAARLARLLKQRLELGVDGRLLGQLGQVLSSKDPYSRSLAAALSPKLLGQAVGKGLHLERDEDLQGVAEFLRAVDDETFEPIATGLIRRSARDEAVATQVSHIFGRYGVGPLLARVPVAAFDDETAPAFVAMVTGLGAVPGGSLTTLVQRMPPKAAASVVATASPAITQELQGVVGSLLRSGDERAVHQMLQLVGSRGTNAAMGRIGDLLLADRGEGWSAKSMHLACRMLRSKGCAESHLLPLVRDRKAPVELRLAALQSLDREPALRAQAVRWTWQEWLFEPPRVKQAFAEARKEGQS